MLHFKCKIVLDDSRRWTVFFFDCINMQPHQSMPIQLNPLVYRSLFLSLFLYLSLSILLYCNNQFSFVYLWTLEIQYNPTWTLSLLEQHNTQRCCSSMTAFEASSPEQHYWNVYQIINFGSSVLIGYSKHYYQVGYILAPMKGLLIALPF